MASMKINSKWPSIMMMMIMMWKIKTDRLYNEARERERGRKAAIEPPKSDATNTKSYGKIGWRQRVTNLANGDPIFIAALLLLSLFRTSNNVICAVLRAAKLLSRQFTLQTPNRNEDNSNSNTKNKTFKCESCTCCIFLAIVHTISNIQKITSFIG